MSVLGIVFLFWVWYNIGIKLLGGSERSLPFLGVDIFGNLVYDGSTKERKLGHGKYTQKVYLSAEIFRPSQRLKQQRAGLWKTTY